MAQCLPSAEHTQLDLVLFPYRSLKPEHFSKILGVLILLCTFGGIRFTLIGAWPVAAFLFLDLIALWFAFYLNYRRARVREEITLTDTLLTVRRTMPNGMSESWRFEPYWVKLNLSKEDTHQNRLELSIHEQSVNIGIFLTPSERTSLYHTLREALTAWKNR